MKVVAFNGSPKKEGNTYNAIKTVAAELEKEGIEIPNENLFDLYIGARGDDAKFEAVTLANKLREAGIKTEVNHMGRSVKAEMKYANKIGAAFTTILGDDELQNKSIKVNLI